jgi:hypothetical protein
MLIDDFSTNEPPLSWIMFEQANLRKQLVKLNNQLAEAKTEIERLRNNQSILITSFRVNMMRLCPDYSPEEFDKDIANMLKEKE